MNDLLASFGVGGDDLLAQAQAPDYPPAVQGRVAHLDADFLAYQVSAESKDELQGLKPRKSLADMQHNARNAAEHLMRLAGATKYVCHVTPTGSNKGGRPGQAVQQEYQGNRADRERPEFLDAIRHFIVQDMNGIAHLDQEADDGMCQANYAAQGPGGSWGQSNLSIIVSMDKDLRMVPGLHYDYDTNEVVCVGDPFGSIWIDESKSSKKIKGWGTKFFWAQCLMGDTADHIRGIPAVPKSMLPTAKGGKSATVACGPVATYDLLKDVHNDKEAFHRVRELWTGLEKAVGYTFRHWQTQEIVTPTQALLGDMQLLWLRRNKNPLDVVAWLKEVTA